MLGSVCIWYGWDCVGGYCGVTVLHCVPLVHNFRRSIWLWSCPLAETWNTTERVIEMLTKHWDMIMQRGGYKHPTTELPAPTPSIEPIALILSGAGGDNLCTWNISTKLLPGAGRQDLCTQRQASLSGQKKGSILSHRLYGSGNGKWHSLHITCCSSCSISNFSRVCRLEDGEAIFFVRIQNSCLPLLKTALNKAYLVMLWMQEKKLAVS